MELYFVFKKIKPHLPIEIIDHIFSFLPPFDKWYYGLKIQTYDKKIHIKGINKITNWECHMSFQTKNTRIVMIEMNKYLPEEYYCERIYNPYINFSYQDMISIFKKKLFNNKQQHTEYFGKSGYTNYKNILIKDITIENLETNIQKLFNHHDTRTKRKYNMKQ